jgi:hypothetical protein
MGHDEWAPEDEVSQASLALCREMAFDFGDETARRSKLMELLRRLGLELEVEFWIPPNHKLETDNARADLLIAAGRSADLLGVVKPEFESGGAYMQASRSYQAIWRAKIRHQMAYHALFWWFMVSRPHFNASVESLIFTPTSHRCGGLLRRRLYHYRATSRSYDITVALPPARTVTRSSSFLHAKGRRYARAITGLPLSLPCVANGSPAPATCLLQERREFTQLIPRLERKALTSNSLHGPGLALITTLEPTVHCKEHCTPESYTSCQAC